MERLMPLTTRVANKISLRLNSKLVQKLPRVTLLIVTMEPKMLSTTQMEELRNLERPSSTLGHILEIKPLGASQTYIQQSTYINICMCMASNYKIKCFNFCVYTVYYMLDVLNMK
ncbi:hypothetical protein MtrunA17_Chr4g0052001 [Medicago truncatula]|uniref:Uncharacterized protein n=1 Tax=Medicago truncatula TaxID=3880 RepID=B7FH39_MEDTR|nr:unknown [Medicago truncatula]AFK44970.1 unknown [Medicago truncatula]KEH31375.1 hypothetical protein MTR_4g094620 [Medicago truncatula]RHN62860.1 hypothetical protein MtrunA17_Chr4g0052001 [Medicago truncatula]